MAQYILFERLEDHLRLQPFTQTRPVAFLRVGIHTIAAQWASLLQSPVHIFTQPYLQEMCPFMPEKDIVFIDAALLPDPDWAAAVQLLQSGEKIMQHGQLLAYRSPGMRSPDAVAEDASFILKSPPPKVRRIENIWDIFLRNDEMIREHFAVIADGRVSAPLSSSNRLVGPVDQLFIEPGAKVEGAILNTETGPIYIGPDAEVMEGCLLRGPIALGEQAVLKMGAKVYGATTLGPYCKAGGELNNVVFFGYSNKAHDGFLGNSVIGEWCNLGADTNNSNLKNNYAAVEVWNYAREASVDSGLTFCGLFMGDHAKCGINTMFNTGTVVGVSANVFGGDFPPKFIPSFSWGGSAWLRTFTLEKAYEVAERVMSRRGKKLSFTDKEILRHVFLQEGRFRKS